MHHSGCSTVLLAQVGPRPENSDIMGAVANDANTRFRRTRLQKLTMSASGINLFAELRPFSSFRRGEWDNFAAASGESFLGAFGVLKARRLWGSVKLFDFVLANPTGSRQKVGQCAVIVGAREVTFLDKIQLLPGQRHLNRQCFDLVAEHFGDVAYKYGSRWNDEEGFDLEGLQRFQVDRSIFHIDLIQFRQWPSFAAYRRAVSKNIRRDYKKAREANAVARTDYGIAGLRELFAFVAMRRHMARRNNLPFSRVRDYFTHAGRLFVLGKKAFITTVRIEGKCYAAFFGAEVGSRLYYLSGGTRTNQLGAGSYMFLNLIETWFSKHPDGEFLMGDCPKPLSRLTHDNGNLLYRRKLRVNSVNGVAFRLRPKQSLTSAAPGLRSSQDDERLPNRVSSSGVVSNPNEIPTPVPGEGNGQIHRTIGNAFSAFLLRIAGGQSAKP